ncbi:FadR/GntR family transcriptional regulator [Mesorhizobium sp. M00.F.Ca.ET.216.01.1.1]|uniref:FadR/GntR family transcriptional regulator n=1 Tax=Mesorhizobium sp. M00.F.Ca.ET.216.01.1.1 TaxID=2500528 RepID=UPI000FD723BB|nr:FadR/GntR family transcriptional regulator [Mesorhizobium sp. M00.F.Ca.ET.216.01.1.1]TGQ34604.1 FadR family transcriptional regulator [Mesorhizobium sp. M00.F.Ca.ET.216.01.1.1]
MPIQAVEPRRLYRQVADQLRQLIDSGEFAVGDRLPTERELADQLGISRPTVREALIALEVEGRIRIRVGSGIYVTDRPNAAASEAETDEGPFELLRAREFVEGAIAAEAALHVRPADLELLDDVLRRMEAMRHPNKMTIALDREFHTSVAGILENAVLVRFIGELFDQRMNPFFERLSIYFENRDSWRIAAEEHRAVRDAIAARDPERAKAAMQHHLRQSQLRFSRNFDERAVAREVAL